MACKPKVAISACLLGQRVRYDGKAKKQQFIVEYLSDKVNFVPFCPEVAIGLGVPRSKIQAVRQKDEQIRILGVENHTWDVTEPLKLYAHDFLQQHADIRHFIVKAKSPSCGYQSTPLFIRGSKTDVIKSSSVVEKVPLIEESLQLAEGPKLENSLQLENSPQLNKKFIPWRYESYEPIALISGMFVQTILELQPEIYIIDETSLATEQACRNFFKQLIY